MTFDSLFIYPAIPIMGATNTGCAQETVVAIHHTFCKTFLHEICKHFPFKEYRTKCTQNSANKRLFFSFSFLRILMACSAVAAHLLILSACLSAWWPLRHRRSELVWFSAVSTKQFFADSWNPVSALQPISVKSCEMSHNQNTATWLWLKFQ